MARVIGRFTKPDDVTQLSKTWREEHCTEKRYSRETSSQWILLRLVMGHQT